MTKKISYSIIITISLIFSCKDKSNKTIKEIKDNNDLSTYQQLKMVANQSRDSIVLDKKYYNVEYNLLFKKGSYSIEDENCKTLPDSLKYIYQSYDNFVVKKNQIFEVDENFIAVYSSFDGALITINKQDKVIDKILLKSTAGNIHWGLDRNFKYNHTKNLFTITDDETDDGNINGFKELVRKIETVVKITKNGKFDIVSQKVVFGPKEY